MTFNPESAMDEARDRLKKLQRNVNKAVDECSSYPADSDDFRYWSFRRDQAMDEIRHITELQMSRDMRH